MPTPDAAASPAYRWLVTLSVMMGAISTTLASTVVNVALPDIMGAFGMGQDQAQWMSTGFLAAMTTTMLTAAWFVARIGLRATFSGALALFVFASIVAGFATSEAGLIGMRVLQGAAAGVMQPLSMIALFGVFPPHQRGAAMGIFGLGVVMAPALGPSIGGILIGAYNWRVVFFFVVPFSILGIVLGLRYLPGRRADARAQAFDHAGFILLCAALVCVLTGLSDGKREGWSSAYILSLLGSGTLLSAIFVLWQFRTPHPLLNFALLRHRVFTSACIVSFIYGAGMFGSTYLVPQFAQGIQRLLPEGVGLMMMPSGLVMAAIFPVAGRISDRISPAILVSIGLFLFGISSLWMQGIDANTPFWTLAWWIAISRIGLGFILPALNAGGVRSLPADELSQGSGVINFVRQLGGAFGTNLLAILLGERSAFHASALTATQSGELTITNDWLASYRALLAQGGIADSLQQQYGALYHLGRTIYLQASTLAFRDCFIVVALLFFASILPALNLRAKPLAPK